MPHGLASFGLAAGLVALLDAQLGSAPQIEIAASTVTTLYTLVLFLVWDLSRYLLHRLLHAWPLLWRFHQVHHLSLIHI